MPWALSGSFVCQCFSFAVQTSHRRRSYLGRVLSQEIAMKYLATRARRIGAALAATLTGSIMLTNAALASQGPGGGMGTAGHLTQVMMAVVVYGASGMIVAAGLIGAARGRSHG
jgi:hypothetical protein